MKLISPKFEIIEQQFPVQKMDMDTFLHKQMLEIELYKHIERCGRTCYKSEDKITEDSAKPFVDRMIASKHYAMLEHGTVYLCSNRDFSTWSHLVERYHDNKYSKIGRGCADYDCYVTTNLRVLVENDWLEDLQYLCAPTVFHKKRYTVRFTCNRQVSHEFVRHRVFSFAQESTRYCNYTKGKFGGELTFIDPCWDYMKTNDERDALLGTLGSIENTYKRLIELQWLPQQAATVLPNALKTELIMTGFADDWVHFFELRALGLTGAPHPQAKELAEPLMNEFIERGYISDIRNGNVEG